MLFLAADVPWPPDGGGRIASLRVLEAFCASHEVDLIALADPIREVAFDHILSLCNRVAIVRHPFSFGQHPYRQAAIALSGLASREPYRLRKFRSRQMLRHVAEWKAQTPYDLVHHEQFGVAAYLDQRLPSTALVQNVESRIYGRGAGTGSALGRAWASIEGRKLAAREPELLSMFDEVFTLSELDATSLREAGVDRVSVVPMPAPPLAPARPTPNRHAILTMGSMSWFGVADGLAWFHDRVLPAIRAEVPDVHWDLVGPGASARIQAFGREQNVTLHGYVPDVAPYVEAARVAVIPLHVAGGIRMKLMELMASGLPAVATTVGAEGIGFRDGEGAFRRDDPVAFARATIDLLTDDRSWQSTADAGRAFLSRARTQGDLRAAIDAGVERAIDRHAERRART